MDKRERVKKILAKVFRNYDFIKNCDCNYCKAAIKKINQATDGIMKVINEPNAD